MGTRTAAVGIVLALAASAVPGPARAALGEGAESVARDRRALAGVPAGRTERGRYAVEEARAPSGTVREYVAPSGLVFAVAWSGRARPDLGILLGAHAGPLRAAEAAPASRPRGRGPRRVEAGGAVLEQWGHM